MAYILHGKLMNTFRNSKGISKDGKEYGGELKIQVLSETKLANGSIRADMETLTVPDLTPYTGKINQTVSVPVALNVYQGKLFVKAIA